MQFKDGASVYSSDQHHIGNVERVVIDPRTKKVTHLVIEQGFLFGEDKVMPVEMVASADEDGVYLNCTKEDIGELPPYQFEHYVDVNETELADTSMRSDFARPLYYYPKYRVAPINHPSYPFPEYQVELQEAVDDTKIALREGAEVISADNQHVGNVEQVFVEGDSDKVSHILISEGLLFKDKKMIPAYWIDKLEEESIFLTVGSEMLAEVPEYKES